MIDLINLIYIIRKKLFVCLCICHTLAYKTIRRMLERVNSLFRVLTSNTELVSILQRKVLSVEECEGMSRAAHPSLHSSAWTGP